MDVSLDSSICLFWLRMSRNMSAADWFSGTSSIPGPWSGSWMSFTDGGESTTREIYYLSFQKTIFLSHSSVRCSKNTYLLTYLLTHSLIHSMQHSPSCEANQFSASQKIPRILRNSQVHSGIHKCLTPVPILNQLDPVHIPKSHFLKIHLNITLPSMPGSPKWSLSLWFSNQNPVYASPLPDMCYMSKKIWLLNLDYCFFHGSFYNTLSITNPPTKELHQPMTNRDRLISLNIFVSSINLVHVPRMRGTDMATGSCNRNLKRPLGRARSWWDMILNCILKEEDGRALTGFIWLRTGMSGGLLWTW